MIERNKYLNQLIKSRNNGMPKVITGIRRCGKSALLKQIYLPYLKEDGLTDDHILIMDLDDDSNLQYRNPVELGRFARAFCGGKDHCVVILDEIQMVDTILNPVYTEGRYILADKNDTNIVSFVDVILGLSRQPNIDLYVTGSNSKMLSADIVTQFRDKAENIRIGPLSFEEFYHFKGGSPTDAIYEYMQFGGMPLAVLKDREDRQSYLKDLFTATYFRDIIERNNLKKSESLDELCNLVSECTGELINAEKIANTFQSRKHEKIGRDTVSKYLQAFEDAFILREAKRYDVKGKKEIGAARKYYFTDTGLRNARLNFAFPDEGQMLENIVYNELIYNDYTVNVGTYETVAKDKNGRSVRNNYEIDFFAKKNHRMYYIQVSADFTNQLTKEREQKAFLSLHDQVQKIIVINKPVEETRDENGLTIIGIADFLLRFIK